MKIFQQFRFGFALLAILILVLSCSTSSQSMTFGWREKALQTVAYMHNIPEVVSLRLDNDNSTLFVEFSSRPPDYEVVLRAAAVLLSNEKKKVTGASGILVYGTQGGMDFEHSFWIVHARYGKIDESKPF